MDTIKQRLCASLLTSPLPPEEVSRRALELAENLQPDGWWEDLAAAEPFAEHADGVPAHLQRTFLLAQANRRGRGSLDDCLRRALDFWLALDVQSPDERQNHFAVPRLIGSVALLFDDGLSAGARGKVMEILARARWEHWVLGAGWTDWSGPDLLTVAHIMLLRGCLHGGNATFEEAFTRVFRSMRIAPEGEEGIQPDMTYRAAPDRSAAGNPGLIYAANCARFIELAHGTLWQPPGTSMDLLVAFLLDGQQWQMRNGVIAPNAPEIGVGANPAALAELAAAVERLAAIGDTPRRTEMAELARRLVGQGGTFSGHRHFSRSGFSVHQRPAYYASLRLASTGSDALATRDNAFADGMVCIMRSGHEHEGIPTPPRDGELVRGLLSPATGVSSGEDDTTFASGVSEGEYGAAAMQIDRPGYRAAKSWCFFDGSFVCLGTGISAPGSNQQVFTTVNHCQLNGPVAAGADLAKPRELSAGTEHNLPAVRRITHDGVTYYFVRPSRVAVQFGGPRPVDGDPSTAIPARFSLRLNHGLHPRDESYSYIVLPHGEDAAAKAKVDEEVAQIEVLSNTPAVQAVRHRALGLVGVTFWQAGTVALAGGGRVAANQPCVLLCRDVKGNRRLSIANLRTKAATVHVEYLGKCLCFELPGGVDAARGVSRSL